VSRLLHAITAPETPQITRLGLRGRPLSVIEAHGLGFWTTALEVPTPAFDRADLLEHHDIMCFIHERVEACLPVRFPTWLPPAGVGSAERFAAALDHVRGRSEIVVTAVWNAAEEVQPAHEAPTSGTDYLRRRQRELSGSDRRRGRARQLSEAIEQWSGPDLVEARHTLNPSAAVALSTALLVPRGSAETVKRSVVRPQPDVRILVNGPWPPYTFAVIVRPHPQDDSALREE
jgi:hypothetical protein